MSSLVGLFIGLFAIIGTLFIESGSISAVIQPTAALVVFGGTIGAAMVNFSLSTIISSLRDLKNVFFEENFDFYGMVNQIYELANISRQEGALIIQGLVSTIDSSLLRKGLQLSIDTNNTELVKDILESEVDFEEERGYLSILFFESLGGYAPTFGIVGAVLGLIQVMGNIENPSELGYGISTAFVATVYGVGAANLIFIPIAGKLRTKLREKTIFKRLITQGVLSIHKGENPEIIREKLFSYVSYTDEAVPYSLSDDLAG